MEDARIKAWSDSWGETFEDAIGKMLRNLPYNNAIQNHIQGTPARVSKAFAEYFAGCFEDPRSALTRAFEAKTDGLIYVNNIGFVSFCAHHLVPFMGKVHFAYLPAGRIVGLSKIPRFIEILAKRPQVQENFTAQMVDIFQDVLQPRGCGAVVEAYHLCMAIRGIKKQNAYTRTTELRGLFRDNPSVKAEFLDGVKTSLGGTLWP